MVNITTLKKTIIILHSRVCLGQSNSFFLEDTRKKRESVQFGFPMSKEISVVFVVSVEACFSSEVEDKVGFLNIQLN